MNEINKESDKNIKLMYHEWARYESFKTFPKDCAVSPLRLAQAGFYHTGKGMETACFSCGVKNANWTENESVIELHKRLSPKCKFINGERTENEESEQNQSGGACGGPEDLSENNTVRETEQREDIERRSESTRINNEVSQETQQNLEQTNTTTGNSYQHPIKNERHSILQNGYPGQYSEYRPTEEIQHFPGITNEQPKHPDYATRSVRLSSFSQWQLGHVKPEDLAEAGFFFCGMQDLVRCFFCGGEMKNWEYGDSPWTEHARWFPTCAYLNQCKGEDFVNLCQKSNMTFPTQTNFNGLSGQYSEYRPTEEIQNFPGITNEQPRHPNFGTRNARLSSFLLWPSGHMMKPEGLAEAGFFFCGIQDLVKCFFCGGGIMNWEYGDSPWIKHARCFRTCAYLKQCMGEDFVNLCQMSNMTSQTQTIFQLRDLDSHQANIVEDQYITDLNSIATKRVLDMGYMQTQVEDAIRNIRQRKGPCEEMKAQNILEYLLDIRYTANASVTTTTPGQHSNTANNGSQSSPNNRQSDQSNVSIGTTERSSLEGSADKTSKATKDETKSLKEENRHLKEQMMCKICMDKDTNTVFLPCGHLVSCVECAHALRKCAVCRTVIQGTIRVYPA